MGDPDDMEVAVAAEEADEPESPGDDKGPEFEPPQASVAKVIKRAVGESVQVGKEAKAALTRAAGIFILYLTACANDFCREGRRTTITVNDIHQALKELDFDDFVEPLKVFLQQYNSAKTRAKESKKAKNENGDEGHNQAGEEEEGGGDEEEAAQPEAGGAAEEEEEEEEEEEGDESGGDSKGSKSGAAADADN